MCLTSTELFETSIEKQLYTYIIYILVILLCSFFWSPCLAANEKFQVMSHHESFHLLELTMWVLVCTT